MLLSSRPSIACAFAAVAAFFAVRARADEVDAALYIRSDTDRTTVIAPRVRGQVAIEEATKLSAVYAVDVWTSASIDIMTSASQVPVTEQRDEFNLAVDHELTDATLTLAYRYSVEPDYVSHGISGGFGWDFADNNATLALGLNASSDTVGHAGDPSFERDSGTAGGRLSFTQVLDPSTLAQVIYEVSRVGGYQVSPYRYVPIAGTGLCTSSVMSDGLSAVCVPETSPSSRLRHALALGVKRALGDDLSIDGSYRFYLDDWGVTSHTLRAELLYSIDAATLLAASYRLYLQSAADHYEPRYGAPQPFVTADKELSTMSSHRLGLELEHAWVTESSGTLTASVSLGGLYYAYSNFLPLDSISALEVTTSVVYTP
jgi:hypothetical protein